VCFFIFKSKANDIPPTYVRLINLLTLLFLVLHWLACLHYLVADLTHRSDQKKKENLSWVSAMDLWDKPVYEKYLHCVLRALSNMVFEGTAHAQRKFLTSIENSIDKVFIFCSRDVWATGLRRPCLQRTFSARSFQFSSELLGLPSSLPTFPTLCSTWTPPTRNMMRLWVT